MSEPTEPRGGARSVSAGDRVVRVRRTVLALVVLVAVWYVGFIVMMGWR